MSDSMAKMESVPNSKPWGKSFDASLSILPFNFDGAVLEHNRVNGDFRSFMLVMT